MGWEVAAVAAIDSLCRSAGAIARNPTSVGFLLASAALALPLSSTPVQAGDFSSPAGVDAAEVGVAYLRYQENGRMRADAPLLWFNVSPDESLQIGGSVDLDTLSGASVQYVSNRSGTPVHALSGASVNERRTGSEVHASKAWGEQRVGVSVAQSRETDYRSQSAAIDYRIETNARNTTYSVGLGHSSDEIGKHGSPIWRARHSQDVLLGVTQLLTARSLVQSNLAYGWGSGDYNDPYKSTLSFFGPGAPVVQPDRRPEARHHLAWLSRYRHFLPQINTALGLDYRYYRDDWGVRAHTVELSAAHTLENGARWVPLLRYYTQHAADFYAQSFAVRSATGSSDTRLAAFGALTLGLRFEWPLTAQSRVDLSLASYRQRAAWRPGGGTPDLPRLDAGYLMLGYVWRF